jgi:hypothetical protein
MPDAQRTVELRTHFTRLNNSATLCATEKIKGIKCDLPSSLPLPRSSILGPLTHAQIRDDAITDEEIEQRAKLDLVTAHKQTARQDVISELADDKDKIREAESYRSIYLILMSTVLTQRCADVCILLQSNWHRLWNIKASVSPLSNIGSRLT